MALQSFAGEFALNTVGGNQAISGVGFQPKVILFFPTLQTANGVGGDLQIGLGAADGSTQWAISVNDEDAQANVDNFRESSEFFCFFMNVAGTNTRIYAASFVSMDADGFTFNITTAPASAYTVGFLALGGTDISNVAIGYDSSPAVSGNKATAGLGFQPTALILASAGLLGPNVGAVDAIYSIGWAKSTSSRGASAFSSDDAVATSDTHRRQNIDRCIDILLTNGNTDKYADLSSFDAGGFTLNWTVSSATNTYFFYIAMNGVFRVNAGSLNSQTSTGNFSESGVGILPNTGIFASFCNAANVATQDHIDFCQGIATDSDERFVAGSTAEDAQGTSDTDNFKSNALIYQNYDFARSQEGAIDFVSWDSGGFTLNQTDADPTENQIIYIVFGSAQINLPLLSGLGEVFPLILPSLIGGLGSVYPLTVAQIVKFLNQRLTIATPGLAEYKVRIKNQSGEAVAELDTWLSLTLTHKVNNRGTLRLEINGEDSRIQYLTPDSNNLDNQIEIWRRNPIIGLDWYVEWEGFLRTNNDLFEQNDNNKFVAFALSYLDLARRAEIKWLAGSSQADKSGLGETVIKNYASENIGPAALLANGREADNVMPGLSIQADLGAGGSWSGAMADKNLLDTLQKVGLATAIDFDIVGTGAAEFQFVTYDGQRNDRTKTNADGNSPVIFALGFGNMIVPVLSRNRTGEVTAAYALGKGVDNARQSALSETLARLDSPWNRIEKTVSASNTSGDDLDSAAEELLEKNAEQIKFNFKVLQTISNYYGYHYWWGDLVTAQYKSEEFDKKITESRITVSPNVEGEDITITFADN